jgi:cysteine-rich CWC protein
VQNHPENIPRLRRTVRWWPAMANPTPGDVRTKRCACCGESFACRAGGCWCDGVPLTDDARASLRERFDDCLCAACLRRHATQAGRASFNSAGE